MEVPHKNKVVHGGCGKRQYEKTHKNVLDFSASTNPRPPIVSWTCDPFFIGHYPDDNYTQVKEVIAHTFNRDVDEICVGNGSMELIRVLCHVVVRHGTTFYTETPTFGEYEFSARLAGGIKVKDMKNAHITFVCNPNNPTGTLRSREEMLSLLDDTHEGILCADEAFIELADPRQSLVDVTSNHLVVLRSLTKCFSVPGLRFGYGFAEPDLIARMEAMRPPWSVNACAESFALQAFSHYHELEESRNFIKRERAWLHEHLSALGLSCSPSSANFLLIDTAEPAGILCEKLQAVDILVRDCTSFGLPTTIRVAVRTRDENRCLVEALAACLH
ncbi:MAG: histidinol-phosphate aminotransferase family protein [Methanoregulaceae archaeon]|nr:histidinol-phosphate aminotransferase family protein [Methanoregulaceae archaeon]